MSEADVAIPATSPSKSNFATPPYLFRDMAKLLLRVQHSKKTKIAIWGNII
jgi:hypothetical protein